MANIFSPLPDKFEQEFFEELLHHKNIRIEKIRFFLISSG